MVNDRKTKDKSEYYVRSVTRALSIIDCFGKGKSSLGVTEISEMLDLHKSTVHALLVTLEGAGYVCKNPETDKYLLSYKLLSLGNVASDNLSLKTTALPYMRELNKITGESVVLHIRTNKRKLAIAVINSSEPMRLMVREGEESTLCFGASGRILMSDMSDEEIGEIIRSDGLSLAPPDIVPDSESFIKEVRKVHSLGYEICTGERAMYAGSVSWPIKDIGGNYVAALTILGPLSRYKGEKLEFYFEQSRICAEKISAALGYIPL